MLNIANLTDIELDKVQTDALNLRDRLDAAGLNSEEAEQLAEAAGNLLRYREVLDLALQLEHKLDLLWQHGLLDGLVDRFDDDINGCAIIHLLRRALDTIE